MSRVIGLQSNFTTGEVDPLLNARIDIEQYYNALAQARNVLIQPQGGVTRRPGLQYIGEIPSAAAPQNGCRLVPFEYSTTQSYMLLFVNNRMYIYKDKVLQTNINSSGNDYLTTTIATANIPTMDYTQSADTLIIVQEDMAPKKIVRGASHTAWTISNITFDHTPMYAFSLSTSAPAQTLTPSAVDGNITLTAGGGSVFAAGNIGDYVEANDGLGRARITGYTSATVVEAIVEIPFFNTNAIASGSWVLEVDYVDTWSVTYGYPRSVTFHEGRLWFGGSKSRPNTIWGSRVSDYFDFNPGEGLDDDSIEATLATDSVNAITGMFSGRDLQVFTKGGEFFLPQSELDPITPSNVVVQTATRRGSKEGIKPVGAESGTLFIQRSGKSLREFLFSDVELSYISNNISLLSSHLLVTPTDMALRRATSTDDGDLLLIVNSYDGSLATYSILKGQNVIAPSLSTTDGSFMNVAVDVDVIYFVVQRSIPTTAAATATITVTDAANIAVGSTITITDHAGTSTTMTATNSDPAGALEFSVGGSRTNNDVADNIAVGTGGVLGINALSGYSAPNPAANVITVTRAVVGGDNLTITSSDNTRITCTNFTQTPTDKYYIECFNDDYTTDAAVQYTVIAGNLPGSTSVSGLGHLEGKTVKIAADDAMQNDKVISSGAITTDSTASIFLEIGLDYTPTIKTMPVELKLPSGNIIAQKKRIVETTAQLYLSQNMTINGNDIPFTAAAFFTGRKRKKPMLGFNRMGQITISQSAPLFFTLLGLEYKVSVGQ